MFSTAYDIVKNFTRPVVISTRQENGTVGSGLATFIIVNKEGWVVTAAHVVQPATLQAQHASARQATEQKRNEILADTSLRGNRRKRQLAALAPNPGWLTAHSFWWCEDAARFSAVHVDDVADVAILKLEGFDTSQIEGFPRFKAPDKSPPPGGSLCRLGFPFVQVLSAYDETSGGFCLENFTLPPMFPNDGIHTRIVLAPDEAAKRTITLIETSTPGLRGQSGGPLFDVKGEVWGIQSKTHFLQLGFTPKTNDGKREVVEHQFMNLGLAVHVKHVIELFEKHGVSYDRA